MNFTLDEIVEATGGFLIGRNDAGIQGICTDSRAVVPGQCFVALVGENHDGHAFIPEAVKRGAAALLVENVPEGKISLPIVKVDDTYQALAELARFHRSRVSPIFIGITGSLGKTTTKEIMFKVLSRQFKAIKSEKSFNNHLGVPLTLLNVEREHEVAVLELGTNAPGEIAFLSRLVKPSIGVITCIARTHLQAFKDLHGVEKAKAELIEGMDRDSILIVNGDDLACRRIAQKFSGRVVTFGCSERADFRADCVQSLAGRLSFKAGDHIFEAPVPGRHNIYNLLTCVSVARELEMPWEEIKSALASITLPPMRMEIGNLGKITLIKDCYNSSPQALLAAVEVLRDLPGSRRIAILGDMLELGDASRGMHYEAGEKIAGEGIDILLCLGQESKALAQGAIACGMIQCVLHFDSFEELMLEVRKKLQGGDVVLVKGSRKLKMERVCKEIEAFAGSIS